MGVGWGMVMVGEEAGGAEAAVSTEDQFIPVFLKKYLFIFWLHRVLVAALGIFCCSVRASL